MGNVSSLITDLTLFVIEFRWITKGERDNRRVPESKRYIDDLIVTNDPQFMEMAKEIYTAELNLNQTNESA